MAFVGVLTLIYLYCLYTLNYDIQDSSMVVLETMGILSTLIMGMCLFRWCSFNRDISSESIWNRVAVRSGTPLKLIKFDMEHVNISYNEYKIDYGDYPNLHEPVVTLTKHQKICNARNLVKITKKDPDPHQPHSYGAIYFHFKGKDEYLLDRWKYEFGKYHNKVDAVFTKCNGFHNVFFQHFGHKINSQIAVPDHMMKKNRSKYIEQQMATKEKEENIINILDGFGAQNDDGKTKKKRNKKKKKRSKSKKNDSYYHNNINIDDDGVYNGSSSSDENYEHQTKSPRIKSPKTLYKSLKTKKSSKSNDFI